MIKQKTYEMKDCDKYWLLDKEDNTWYYFVNMEAVSAWKKAILTTYLNSTGYEKRYELWKGNKQVDAKEIADTKRKRDCKSHKQTYQYKRPSGNFRRNYVLYERTKEYMNIGKPVYTIDDYFWISYKISKCWKDQTKKRKQYEK